MELEGEAETIGKVRKAFPRGFEGVERRAETGETNTGWTAGTCSEDVEKSRPLKTLHDVEIDDVHTIFTFEGFLNGLVGGEVGELDERADAVEELEGGGETVALEWSERRW